MAYSPKFQRQRSYSCPPLDIASWCGARTGRRTGRFARRLGPYDDDEDYYDDEEFETSEYNSAAVRSNGSRWRVIWRKIVKEKRRIFDSGAPAHEPYDEHTYAQNFDEGVAWVEPENLSRSFSARFAAHPRMMLRRVS